MPPGSGDCPVCGPVPHEANPNTQPNWLIDWEHRPCPNGPGSHDICVWNPTPPKNANLANGGSHNSYPGSAMGGCYPVCVIYVDLWNVVDATARHLAKCGPQTKEFILVAFSPASLVKAKKKKNFRTIVGAAERAGIRFYTHILGNPPSMKSPLRFP